MKEKLLFPAEKLITKEPFTNLYPINSDLMEEISEEMKIKGFDENHPIETWEKGEEMLVIDGHTRLMAAKQAGLEEVWIVKNNYSDENEALKDAIKLQIQRRNLDEASLMASIKLIKESNIYETLKGNKNAAIGKMLGKSEKTIERMNFILNNGTEEQIQDIINKKTTKDAVTTELRHKKYAEENATEEQKKRVEEGECDWEDIYKEIKEDEKLNAEIAGSQDGSNEEIDFPENFDEALEDTSGNPKGISIPDHSDHIERPSTRQSPEEDSERTRERKEAYNKGFSEGFWNALIFTLSEIIKGKNPKEIYEDERLSDLSPYVITNFKLPEDAEDLVNNL